MQQQYSNSTLSDFNILKKLGEGPYSSVFKVQRKSDGQYYAMKRVNIHQHSLKEKENALNKIRTLASLDSPYIVEFKDAFIDQDGRILYILMEFASGGDLNQILTQGKQEGGIQESEIWKILIQIILGVKVLHDNQILHQDLKSENVFVFKILKENHYKIGDFNIGKVTRKENAETGSPCIDIILQQFMFLLNNGKVNNTHIHVIFGQLVAQSMTWQHFNFPLEPMIYCPYTKRYRLVSMIRFHPNIVRIQNQFQKCSYKQIQRIDQIVIKFSKIQRSQRIADHCQLKLSRIQENQIIIYQSPIMKKQSKNYTQNKDLMLRLKIRYLCNLQLIQNNNNSNNNQEKNWSLLPQKKLD